MSKRLRRKTLASAARRLRKVHSAEGTSGKQTVHDYVLAIKVIALHPELLETTRDEQGDAAVTE